MNTKTVLISVSGGRTSGYMAWWMKNNPQTVAEHIGTDSVRFVYVFANTGMEHPDTLRFIQDMDAHFDLGIVWVEGVTHFGKRKASTHRIVDFDSAFRHDQFMEPDHPFHSYIRKYGIPNVRYIGCTREMKLAPIHSYMASLGFKKMEGYHTAIGIRSDEGRRVSKNAGAENIIYPLTDLNPVDKEDVLEWWSQYDWDLAIPEWLGNCVMCYKKSYKKLAAVYQDFPQAFDFTAEMERLYPRVGLNRSKEYENEADRRFFRMGVSTKDLLHSFQYAENAKNFIDVMQDAGCSESCEMFETEDV